MNSIKDMRPNGYNETIEKGLNAVRYFGGKTSFGKGERNSQIKRLKKEIVTTV